LSHARMMSIYLLDIDFHTLNNPGWRILCLNPSSIVRTLNSLTPSTHSSCNPFSLDQEILITFHSINQCNIWACSLWYSILHSCLLSCWEYHTSVLFASIFLRFMLMTFNEKTFVHSFDQSQSHSPRNSIHHQWISLNHVQILNNKSGSWSTRPWRHVFWTKKLKFEVQESGNQRMENVGSQRRLKWISS